MLLKRAWPVLTHTHKLEAEIQIPLQLKKPTLCPGQRNEVKW